MNGMELKELLDTVSEKVRKETAEEIIAILKGYNYDGEIDELIEVIAKKYGVDTKE